MRARRVMKSTHVGRGNQNAAKAPDKRRVTLSLRVLPETRERLKCAAEAYGSMSRAVDHLAAGTATPATVQS